MLDPENEMDERFVGALERIARELCLLGNAGAVTSQGTEMGAIEALGKILNESLLQIANVLDREVSP